MSNRSNRSSLAKSLTRSLTKPLPTSASGATLSSSVPSSESISTLINVNNNNNNGKPQSSEVDTNYDILDHALSMTNLIFGIYAIELWHYDEASGKLFNVNLNGSKDEETGRKGSASGGLYIKRKSQEADPINDYATSEAQDAYNNLTDASRKGYLGATPTDPGVGLSGALWAESSSSVPAALGGLGEGMNNLGNRLAGGGRRTSLSRQHGSERIIRRNNSSRNVSGGVGGGSTRGLGFHSNSHDTVTWRDVGELANDPDQPHDDRLQALAKAGFKLAAGIPFDINGYRGIVIYYGNPHADNSKLKHPSNSKFMNSAAKLIGSAAEIQAPMEQIKSFRKDESKRNWRKLKIKILTVVRFGGYLRNAVEDSSTDTDNQKKKKTNMKRRSSIARLSEASVRLRNDTKETLNEAKEAAKNKATRWGKKVRGGSAGIPPSFTWVQCFWSFVGVITTHTILSRINLLIGTESEGDLSLILAPLGALTTLQYNLTAAPASQPRNAIFAQVFALVTTILLSYIPNIPPWFRTALAPAIVIPGMAKLGIIHPPAGAAAIVFASGKVRWEHFGIFLSGVAITIITAVGINNMSDRRQYPTSWYLVNKAKNSLLKD